MANATSIVKKGAVRRTDEFIRRSSVTLAAALQFYTHAMVGMTTAGYLAKYDDSQSMVFVGLVRGNEGNPLLPIGTAGDYDLMLDVVQPFRFELAVSGVAVTDIGKTVYASDDQTGVMTNGGTYSNPVGIIVDVAASGIALVEPVYGMAKSTAGLAAAKTMAATGAQSLTKFDLNKVILLPNTAAYALTLPAVAGTQAGDRLTFVKTTAAAFAVTLTGSGAETIDGSNTLATIDAQYDCATLVSTGTEWVVAARDIA